MLQRVVEFVLNKANRIGRSQSMIVLFHWLMDSRGIEKLRVMFESLYLGVDYD